MAKPQRLTRVLPNLGSSGRDFAHWWAFCQLPQNDGQASDGPGTRWGWTFPTWQEAQRWGGYTDLSQAGFDSLNQGRAELLANEYFWTRLQAPYMNPGADVSLVDWRWTSGGAVMEIQGNLGVVADNVIGPLTLAAINARKTFVSDCCTWRQAYYVGLGLSQEYPGLMTRATACKAVALQLGGS